MMKARMRKAMLLRPCSMLTIHDIMKSDVFQATEIIDPRAGNCKHYLCKFFYCITAHVDVLHLFETVSNICFDSICQCVAVL